MSVKKWICALVMVVCLLFSLNARAVNDWENETVVAINKEPGRASGLSFDSVKAAIQGVQWDTPRQLVQKRYASDYYQSLDGPWQFNWVKQPDPAARAS